MGRPFYFITNIRQCADRWGASVKEKIYTTVIAGKSFDLWISDEPGFISECVEHQIPVIEYAHAEENGSSGSREYPDDTYSSISNSYLTPWAADSVEAVKNDPEYMEKVVHRFAGVPLKVAETAELTIRELCEGDAESVERIFSEGSVSGWTDIWSGDKEDRRKALRDYCSLHYDLYGYGYYGVEVKEDGVLAGIIGFREYETDFAGNKSVGQVTKRDDYRVFVIKGADTEGTPLELGYIMAEKYRRKGYCVAAGLELIKKTPGDVYIVADINNIPGIKAAEKLSGQTGIFASDSSA